MSKARHFDSRLWRGLETVRNQSRLRPVHFGAGAKIMAKSNLRLVAPDSELRTVTPRRRSNRDMGPRAELVAPPR